MVYSYMSCLCCGLQVVRGCVWFQLVCLLFCPFVSSDTACRVPTDCDAKLQYFATALAVFCCLIRFLLFNVVYSPFLIPHSKHPLSVCTPSPYPTATCKQPASKKTTTTLSVYFEFFFIPTWTIWTVWTVWTYRHFKKLHKTTAPKSINYYTYTLYINIINKVRVFLYKIFLLQKKGIWTQKQVLSILSILSILSTWQIYASMRQILPPKQIGRFLSTKAQ